MSILDERDEYLKNPFFTKREYGDFTPFYITITVCSVIGFILFGLNIVFCWCSPWRSYWQNRHTGECIIELNFQTIKNRFIIIDIRLKLHCNWGRQHLQLHKSNAILLNFQETVGYSPSGRIHLTKIPLWIYQSWNQVSSQLIVSKSYELSPTFKIRFRKFTTLNQSQDTVRTRNIWNFTNGKARYKNRKNFLPSQL